METARTSDPTYSETPEVSYDIVAADQFDIDWFSTIAGYAPPANAQGIKLVEQGIIEMMVVMDYWTHTSCNMHIYVRTMLRSHFLRELFNYVFNTCGLRMALAVVPESVTGSVRIARKLGFKELYRIPDGWKVGEDMLLLQMLREDCRWV